MSDPQAALFEAAENSFDLVIVNSNFDDYDPLRLCSQLRSLERTPLYSASHYRRARS
jgi:two-component system cell cycle response regulator